MELIKQIKEAEAQARETVGQGKKDASRIVDDARKRRQEDRRAAEESRIEAISRAKAEGQTAGEAEIDRLKNEAEQRKRQLQESSGGKVEECVGRVMGYLQQL